MRCLFVLIALLFATSSARAISISDLRAGCEAAEMLAQGKQLSEIERIQAIQAGSYVAGIVDAVQFLHGMGASKMRIKFPQRGISSEVQLAIILQHLRSNPTAEKSSARVEVLTALIKSFGIEGNP